MPNFESQLNISANLSREDRAYLEKIDAQLLALLKGKHVREVKDTETLKQVLELVKARGEYLRMNAQQRAERRDLRTVEVLKATTGEGVEVEINLTEKMREWQTFYAEEHVDWVEDSFPKQLKVHAEQAKEMQRLMEMGYTKMIIIPNGLVDEPDVVAGKKLPESLKKNARKLFALLTAGYSTNQGTQYENSGGVGCSSGVGGARILLVKPVRELDEDAQYEATMSWSTDELNTLTVGELGIPGFSNVETKKTLKDLGLLEFDEVAYWLLQRKYFKETGKHLDAHYSTVFQGSRRFESDSSYPHYSRRAGSALVPCGRWTGKHLRLDADALSSRGGIAGSRLAGKWEFLA